MISRISTYLLCCVFPIALAIGQRTTSLAGKSVKGEKKHHTSVQLVSSVKSVTPGSEFTVGILMKMDRGWHTYWKNSGEAGLPTVVKWKLPEGFTAGEIRWPLPHKYNETGEVLTYGYADENMLLVDIRVPATAASLSSAVLHANVEWLECENICVPGNASVDLKLPVTGVPSSPDHASLFEKYGAQIPTEFSDKTGFIFTPSLSTGTLSVSITPKAGRSFVVENDALPDLYPEPIDELVMGRTKVTATPSEVTLRIPLSVYEKTDRSFTFRGVIVYQMEGGERRSAVIEVPLSKEYCSALPIAAETAAQGNILDQTFSTVQSGSTAQPLYLYVLYAFIGGLLLNIMPCVLPVIGLKIFGLVKMAGDDKPKVKKLGWVFSLGIFASFLALAFLVIILKSAGEQVGWGFQFQEPLFVIAMCAVVFAFGLSLFGVYEINLPGAAVAGVGDAVAKVGEKGGGYTASFSEGVFATILATPCTAPILGTALGFAFSQPAGVILLIFTSTALGMALPYLLLTSKPGWMRFLPRPGEWMVTAKQFMGFLMMATLLWLLYVLGKQLGMEGVIWTSAFLLCVGLACWMIGRFATLVASRASSIRTWVAAIIVVVAGYWIFLESILDVRSVIAGVPATSQTSPLNTTQGIQWQPFSLDDLNARLQENKTIFIDFTAEWCLTCKVNEKTVLADERVIQRFKSAAIVPLRADWTTRNPDITRLLSKFGRSGVPLYVIFPAGKSNQPIVLPEVITSGIVIDAIDKASPSTAARISL